jgi:hypothetical protein
VCFVVTSRRIPFWKRVEDVLVNEASGKLKNDDSQAMHLNTEKVKK